MVGGEPTPKPSAELYSFPAPTRGWILNENLAAPTPGGALALDNYVCTLTGARPRAGREKYATLGDSVTSLFGYKSGTTEKLFGATDDSIFDITVVVDTDVAPTADVTGQLFGIYSTEQFGTVGGDYLYAVNGVDSPQLFDGSTWTAITGASSPAITDVTTSDLSHVWSFASRLFFVKKNTMSAWFLPVDSIAGAAVEFSLAGIFKKGGALLFGATWSLDAGDGLDDKCVFVSTEGEVAVYEGTNPASAADWRLAGLYNISKPLGANATMQAGGDLLIATESGLVPISQAVSKDAASLALNSVSAPITTHWQERANALTSRGWEILKWSQKNYLMVTQPGDTDEACLVANLQTGAWSRFTGWPANCFGYYNDQGYLGADDGVFAMEQTGSDDGANYTCVYLGQFETLSGIGTQKTVNQMRAMFQVRRPIDPQMTMAINFDERVSMAPNSVLEVDSVKGWDTALWDEGTWDGLGAREGTDRWHSIGRTGYAFAPEVQMTFGVADAPSAELVSIDVTFTQGALVT